MRVLLVAPPYAGHLNPLFAVASHLSSRGAVCGVVTGPAKLPACHALGLDAFPVLPDDPDAMERIANTRQRVAGHPVRAYRQVRTNLRLLPRALPDVQAAADRFRPDVIVADFCAPVAGVVARRHGVPWVTTVPTPFAIENRRGTPAYCGGWTPPDGVVGAARDAAGRGLTRGLKHLTGRLFRSELQPFGGSLYRRDGSEAFYSDQAIVALGLAELEFERDWPPVMQFVGPITASPGSPVEPPPLIEPSSPIEPDVEIHSRPGLDKLDQQPRLNQRARLDQEPRLDRRTRVLVTMGTHLPWAKDSLTEQVAALAQRLPGFAFTVCLGDSEGGSVPVRPAGGVEVVPWLPYDSALRAFDVVLHHGGAGITYSALRAGLPSVVWPQDYDQFDFAARIVHRRVGVRIRRLDDAVAALPRALTLPRAPLDRFAELVRASAPLAAVDRVLDELVGRAEGPPRSR